MSDAYKNDVKIVFKHFPLSFHPNAMPAAEAAEAAHEQGKFWEMEEKIFANQGQMSAESYEKWAQEIGLDMGKFKKAVSEHKFKSRIEDDLKLGGLVGVDGTPSFFINGVKMGGGGFDAFKAAIDAELAKAKTAHK